jgi:S-DNA-T family DNA segregation ATPase FtsK/SpoIIIE
MRIGVTALTPQGPRDVVISGDDTVTVSQVAAALEEAFDPKQDLAPVFQLPTAGGAGHAPRPMEPGLWTDGQRVPPGMPAPRALRDGAVVSTDPRAAHATVLAEPRGVVELRVVSGPSAGSVHRLGTGAATFGSAPNCQAQIIGPGVPGFAGTVTVGLGEGSPLLEPAVTPGLVLDGTPVEEPTPWPFGGVLRVGTAVLELVRPEPPDAHLSPSDDGGLAYNRPPRLRHDASPPNVTFPGEPKKSSQQRMLLIMTLVPLAMGGLMVYLTKEIMYAAFMLMSPVMMGFTYFSNRKEQGGSHRRKMRKYQAEMAELEAKLQAVKAADERQRRDDALDPARILLTATGPRRRLWERRAEDADTLRLRIGTFDAPARVNLTPDKGAEKTEKPQPPTSFSIPVSASLPKLGVLGVAGPAPSCRALARWFVAQSAVLHSPRDLQIVVLATGKEAAANWNWVRWLPHSAPFGSADAVVMVGTDPDSAAKRVAELVQEVTTRLTAASDSPGPSFNRGPDDFDLPSPALGPKVLLVLDGARQLRRIPGMPQVLAAARRTGIYAICLDESPRVLPEECAAVLAWDIPGSSSAELHGERTGPGGWVMRADQTGKVMTRPFLVRGHGAMFGQSGTGILADQVSVGWADRVARALAPIRDVSRDDGGSLIPSSARLLDIIHMPDPAPELVREAWRRRGRTTKVPIGISADGPFILDLSADGPHGLVAGTTGAGKSELLQTIIAVLCVANRPDAMTFVLIDYKGGSAFKDCARLPHTVGMVSDLDGHLTVRALDSLGAELKRREEMLLHSGAKDIEDYWDTKRLRPELNLEPMPRLVLIIDEFAAMVAELPDFVDGLIDIARRGRSLGVHLILATQRPAGVVSADIRANTNLRIALRVTSADESTDVIDARDAAYISKSTPGRCYVRSGASQLVGVQSARIGGRRPGTGPVTANVSVLPVDWRDLGRPLPVPRSSGSDDETMETDLSVLVDAIAAANAQLGLGEQRKPWLEPLPENVLLAGLPATPARDGDVPPIPFGLTDLPHRQAREALTLDFQRDGHLVVAGAARTGRSTLLRTLAGSVATTVSPADVHIYGLDCGTGALLPLAELPHAGAVVPREQVDRVERLIRNLRNEIARRQQVLSSSGFAGLAEQRAATPGAQRLPWMLLLLDWWEGFIAAFSEYDSGRLVDALLQILREGSAVGLRAVVTTDRMALLGQVATVFERRMIFRLADRSDSNLAEVREKALPAHQPEGRVMFHSKPNPLEAQIALLDADPSGLAQLAALRAIGQRARETYGRPPREQRPIRVDALPIRITVAETLKLDPEFTSPSPMWAMVGAGGDELRPVGLDLNDDGSGLIVAGPPRSGRSTTLMTMARSLIAAETPILIITPRRSPLRTLDGTPGVLAVLGSDFETEFLRETLNPLSRYAVLVDDAELLHDTVNAPVLERIIISGRDTDHGLIMAGTTADLSRAYSGFIATARRFRSGVLVAVDTPDDGDLFGVRLPRNAGPGPLGRGILFQPGRSMPIQLAVDA